jgi:predicted metal-binding protein
LRGHVMEEGLGPEGENSNLECLLFTNCPGQIMVKSSKLLIIHTSGNTVFFMLCFLATPAIHSDS